jgi:ribose 5-phosphate isomerase A
MNRELMKRYAATKALEYVKSGMTVGIGSGSTVKYFIKFLARKKNKEKLDIKIVAASYDSEITAIRQGLTVLPLYAVDRIDLDVDGADFIDKDFSLIKGGGAALVREKIIAYNSDKFIVIADKYKLLEREYITIPVAVLPLSWRFVKKELEKMTNGNVAIRVSEKGKNGPIITDDGAMILDLTLKYGVNLKELELKIKQIPGVIDCGIFSLRKPEKIIIGKGNQEIEVLELKV